MTEATDGTETSQAHRRYPACVITHQTLRRSLVAAVAGVLLVLAAPSAALADTPASWDDPPAVSGFEFLLVLFLIPLGLALVIGVLAAIPAIVGSNKGYQAGRAWHGEPQWFGGPREGAEGADAEADAGAGGASARW